MYVGLKIESCVYKHIASRKPYTLISEGSEGQGRRVFASTLYILLQPHPQCTMYTRMHKAHIESGLPTKPALHVHDEL